MNDQRLRKINKNFNDLIMNKMCSREFARTFGRKIVFTKKDVEGILFCAANETTPDKEKVYDLYNCILVQSNKPAWELIRNAIKANGGQSVVCDILTEGILCLGTRFRAPPPCIIDLFYSRTHKIIILESFCPQMSLERLEDTLNNKILVIELDEATENVILDDGVLGVVLKDKRMTITQIVGTLADTKTEGMFVVLCEQASIPQLDVGAMEGGVGSYVEILRWKDFTPSYQEKLAKGLGLNPDGVELATLLDFILTPDQHLIQIVKEIEGGGLHNPYYLAKLVEEYLQEKKVNLEVVLDDLALIAMQQYYPQKCNLPSPQEPPQFKNDEELQTLVEKKILKMLPHPNFQYNFMSECVAHYFLGMYLIRNPAFPCWTEFFETEEVTIQVFQGCPENPTTVELKTFEFKHKITVYFVDFHMNSGGNDIHFLWLDTLNQVVSALVNGNFANILGKTFHKNGINDDLVFLAVYKGNLKMIGTLLQAYKKDEKRKNGNDIRLPKFRSQTLLHLAVRRGNFEIFKFILIECGFDNSVLLKRQHMKNLIDLCIKGTAQENEKIINDRKKMIKMLLEVNVGLVNANFAKKFRKRRSNINVELFKFVLAEKGRIKNVPL